MHSTLDTRILQDVSRLMELAEQQVSKADKKLVHTISEHPAVQFALSLLLMYFARYCWEALRNLEHLSQHLRPSDPDVKDLSDRIANLKAKGDEKDLPELEQLEALLHEQLERSQFKSQQVAKAEWHKWVRHVDCYFDLLKLEIQGFYPRERERESFRSRGSRVVDHSICFG